MHKRVLLIGLVAIAVAGMAFPQASTYGRLEGVIRDAQGGVLPGVTVTLSGPAASRVATSDIDGSYRFQALPPATYRVSYDLPGFQTLNREGIIVTTGRTVSLNITLEIASVAETVTVTGESPIVDVKSTGVMNTFDSTALQDVPSATDVWAVLAQSSGVRMRGYDVGGSHKSQQTQYEAFGIRRQVRVLAEGVDTTEGTGGTGGYYDYYSVEEFQVSAAGADVEMTGPGASIVMTSKSGGNQFSSLVHADWEDDSFVADNVDDQTAARGFTGNPNLQFWEVHADVGGPIVKDRVWFFGAYNHFRIDKAISGVDPNQVIGGIRTTDLGDFDQYVGKLNIDITDKDQFIGYSQWGLKQKPNRGLSNTVGPASILAQDSWSWVHKAEWQRVWSDRAFSNIQIKHFGFGWPMVPAVDPATNPARQDTATSIWSGAGFNNTTSPPFTFNRFKPQVTGQLNYYVPAAVGAHDFKLGFEWQDDQSKQNSNSNSGDILYLDNSDLGNTNNVDELRFFSTPLTGVDNRDEHYDFYAQDTWTPTDRVTINAGVRFSRQRAYYPDAELSPNLTFTDPSTGQPIFATGSVAGQDLQIWNTVSPRLGLTYDLTGQGRTVVKGSYGRYYFNMADALSSGNPASVQWKTFKFLDQNGNAIFDGVQELGDVVPGGSSGAGGATVVDDLEKAYADEFAASVEHELAADTSVRVSYVRKMLRNDYGRWNVPQQEALFAGRGVPCGDAVFPCPTNPLSGQPITGLLRVPGDVAGVSDVRYATFPDSDGDYDTLQFAFNRRFNADFFIQASFDYQWRDELRAASSESTSPLVADPLDVGSDNHAAIWQNHSTDALFRQSNTNWGGKILARYVFPQEIAFSANFRHQSGFPWAPIYRTNIPGSGTQPIFLSDIDQNRSENVNIFDFRVEKAFRLGDRYRVTAMADVFNAFNGNPETNINLRTGSNFNNIIAALDPRTLKLGIRFQF